MATSPRVSSPVHPVDTDPASVLQLAADVAALRREVADLRDASFAECRVATTCLASLRTATEAMREAADQEAARLTFFAKAGRELRDLLGDLRDESAESQATNGIPGAKELAAVLGPAAPASDSPFPPELMQAFQELTRR